jgi:hypothetical protein
MGIIEPVDRSWDSDEEDLPLLQFRRSLAIVRFYYRCYY